MAYTREALALIWSKAAPIPGYDSDVWRRDEFGTAIKWSEYGDLSKYGWDVDHRLPQSRGGGDTLENLWPMHWRNNKSKGDA